MFSSLYFEKDSSMTSLSTGTIDIPHPIPRKINPIRLKMLDWGRCKILDGPVINIDMEIIKNPMWITVLF